MAAGLITSGSHSKLLWPGLKLVYDAVASKYPAEYLSVFEVMTSDKRYEEFLSLAGVGLPRMKGEGMATYYGSPKQGFVTRVEHNEYSLGVIISSLMRTDVQYSQDLLAQSGESMRHGMTVLKDMVAADIFNFAFATKLYGDGKVLCATDHPLAGAGAGTMSNRLAVDSDFSEAALETALIQLGDAVDDNGIKIPIRAQKLIHHTSEEFNVDRVLMNPDRPATADRDINVINRKGKIPGGAIMLHQLTDLDAWFVITDQPHGLVWLDAAAASGGEELDFDTGNLKVKIVERFSCTAIDTPRCIIGSPGA